MKRRSLLMTLGIGATVPAGAVAQSASAIVRIGVLSPFSPAGSAEWHRAFENGLRQLGWIDGSNIAIEYRFAGGARERLADFAAELVRLKINLIVTEVTEASLAAQKATSTIPIVIVAVGDPVAAGLVASLARPGANITGLSQNIVETAGKRMEMLRLMVPDLSEVAVLWNPDDNNSGRNWQELQESARRVGLPLKSLEVRSADDIGRALDNESGTRSRALYVAPGPIFVAHLQMIADVAKARRIASIFHLPEFVHVGGLLAYGPDRNDQFRRAAAYVDKILRGAKPSDLPVEQPTKLGLSVNLATARAIGMSVPSLLLAQANEVIE